MKVGRWTLTAADTLNYSPNSPFGGYGYTLAPAQQLRRHSSVVNPQYVPNQSILTPYTSSYFNTVLGQARVRIDAEIVLDGHRDHTAFCASRTPASTTLTS